MVEVSFVTKTSEMPDYAILSYQGPNSVKVSSRHLICYCKTANGCIVVLLQNHIYSTVIDKSIVIFIFAEHAAS